MQCLDSKGIDPPLTPACGGYEPAFWASSIFMVQPGAIYP
jgi:hypothetical protein